MRSCSAARGPQPRHAVAVTPLPARSRASPHRTAVYRGRGVPVADKLVSRDCLIGLKNKAGGA
jgi:hypothetical protein